MCAENRVGKNNEFEVVKISNLIDNQVSNVYDLTLKKHMGILGTSANDNPGDPRKLSYWDCQYATHKIYLDPSST